MVKQYLSIKENYADAILFYRMGDFYEMFFEDAEVAAPVLEITLTSRNKNNADSIPMCGVPVKAVDNYIGRLIEHGYKVAICEQIEDPATAKGIVKRDVVRVVTPGMIIDNALLDEASNNYVLSLAQSNGTTGLSYLDISTGTFRICESDNPHAIYDEIRRVSPSEIILPSTFKKTPSLETLFDRLSENSVSFLDDRAFDFKTAKEKLTELFKTRSLEGFGCENLKAGVGAAGALLNYVRETQKQEINHLAGIEAYDLSKFLLIDDISCRNLELIKNIQTGGKQGTLLGIIDQTATAMGARLLKTWVRYPLIETEAIQSRLDSVEEAKNFKQVRKTIRQDLKSVNDLERLSSRTAMGRANARDLIAIKDSLNTIPSVLSALAPLATGLFQVDSHTRAESLENLHELAQLIDKAIREDAPPTINEGGIIKPGYNSELDELIKISRDGKSWLLELEAREKEKTGISSLKVRYNRVFGYYIEISKNRSSEVPSHYVRKQTLVNAERYITDELKTFETKVLNAHEQRSVLERELFDRIRQQVIENNHKILSLAGFIAQLDCIFTLAEVAEQNDYIKPEITEEGTIFIEEGRHPVVEKLITGERYVPNSINLDNEKNQILVITGPNMAGKSTVLRQTALVVLMAQIGSFVPADRAQISVTDRIFTRVGALDNLSSGQSTFMVEMEETANILNNASSRSLIIIDEIGRGTSTFDGLSIAWAVAEYLHDFNGLGVKTLFATHYHELTQLSELKPRVQNFNIAVKEWNDEIIFLRKLVEGGTNRSYGIQVARLAGLPEQVIKRSKDVLSSVENGEGGSGSISVSENSSDIPEKKQKQLSLFRKPEEIIIDRLQNLNISNLTPIEALNYLNELKEKAKKASL